MESFTVFCKTLIAKISAGWHHITVSTHGSLWNRCLGPVQTSSFCVLLFFSFFFLKKNNICLRVWSSLISFQFKSVLKWDKHRSRWNAVGDKHGSQKGRYESDRALGRREKLRTSRTCLGEERKALAEWKKLLGKVKVASSKSAVRCWKWKIVNISAVKINKIAERLSDHLGAREISHCSLRESRHNGSDVNLSS